MVYSQPLPAVIYDWTGFYLGGDVGAAWASATLSDGFTGGSISNSMTGFVAGGQLGYNWQIGALVLGAEADLDLTSLNASGTAANIAATAKTKWIGTLAARFGWALNNWLLYGKAGGGWINNQVTLTNGTAQVSGSNTNSGLLLGGGVEFAFAPNWTAKFEYDYLGLNTWTLNSTLFAPAADQLSVKRQINMFTIGLNYKFSSGF